MEITEGHTTKKLHGVLKATFIVSLIAILGKLIGFARNAVIAAYYGATWQTDAFFFAQGMPGMIFPAVCNSLSTAFVSLYITYSVEKGKAGGERFASRMLIATLGIAVVLSGVALVIAPWIVPLLAPGFKGAQLILAVHLTRLTMGAFVLTMAQYMLSAILNSKKMFYRSQVAGLGYSVTVIVVTIALGRGQSVDALTLTVIFGHFVQVLILIGLCIRHFKFTMRINPFHSDTKMLLKLALPILMGNSMVQINEIVDKLLGSLLGDGTISALSYSSSLNSFVTGVFVTSLSTVIYPTLTDNVANKNLNKFKQDLLKSLGLMPLLILPVSLITIFEAHDIISIIYKRGSFDSNATYLTAFALTYYAGMYVFVFIREVLVRSFYAFKDTKTPMINSSLAVISNAIFSIILSRYLGIGGIALGTTLSVIITSGILWFSIKKKLPDLEAASLYAMMVKIIASGLIMVVLLMTMQNMFSELSSLIRFLLITLIGFAIYFGTLVILKCKEFIDLILMLKGALKKEVF